MRKKLLLVFSVTACILILFTLNVSAETYGSLTYKVENDMIIITGCDTDVTEVLIPSHISGYPVTSIESSFAGCGNLTSIIIPDTVNKIGAYSFSRCYKLENIQVSKNLKVIGIGAFEYCYNLKNITLPNGVTTIYKSAFAGCTTLTTITIPDSVTIIGDWAFNGCGKLTNIKLPMKLSEIGVGVFNSCSYLATVTIPNSVTSIGNYAFNYCFKLTNVYYMGNKNEWNHINIDSNNVPLNNATVQFVKHIRLDISDDGNNFKIEPVNVDTDKMVILALYDQDTFIGLQASPYKYSYEIIYFTTTKEYTSAKVMIWDNLDNLNPVCACEVAEQY